MKMKLNHMSCLVLKLKFIFNGYNLQKNENWLNHRPHIMLNDNTLIDKMITILDDILIAKS